MRVTILARPGMVMDGRISSKKSPASGLGLGRIGRLRVYAESDVFGIVARSPCLGCLLSQRTGVDLGSGLRRLHEPLSNFARRASAEPPLPTSNGWKNSLRYF